MSQKVIVHARDNSTGKPQITGASGGRYALGSVLVINCSDDDEWEISEGGLHEVNANGVPDELIPSSALPGVTVGILGDSTRVIFLLGN